MKIVEKSDEYQQMMVEESSNLQFAKDQLASTEEELNIQILKHYGLDWVINLDNEYEKLIKLSS